MTPGSLPRSTELFQEGFIIPPLKLVRAGQINQEVVALFCRNSRTPDERRGDLAAQIAACRTGERRLQEMVDRYGWSVVYEHEAALLDYSERLTRAAISALPDGDYSFRDVMDDDGLTDEPVPIAVTVSVRGDAMTLDFSETAAQRRGCINAPLAVTLSAALYVLRCVVGEAAPANQGILRPVTVLAPEGSLVNPRPPAAVAAGNVETSQRITDVLLGALAKALPDVIPAASQGTMNNVLVGGHQDGANRGFAYYETIAGGMGARPGADGLSAVHTHMTNTMNTPIEALELYHPMRVRSYRVRRGSGGDGRLPWRRRRRPRHRVPRPRRRHRPRRPPTLRPLRPPGRRRRHPRRDRPPQTRRRGGPPPTQSHPRRSPRRHPKHPHPRRRRLGQARPVVPSPSGGRLGWGSLPRSP